MWIKYIFVLILGKFLERKFVLRTIFQRKTKFQIQPNSSINANLLKKFPCLGSNPRHPYSALTFYWLNHMERYLAWNFLPLHVGRDPLRWGKHETNKSSIDADQLLNLINYWMGSATSGSPYKIGDIVLNTILFLMKRRKFYQLVSKLEFLLLSYTFIIKMI